MSANVFIFFFAPAVGLTSALMDFAGKEDSQGGLSPTLTYTEVGAVITAFHQLQHQPTPDGADQKKHHKDVWSSIKPRVAQTWTVKLWW